MTDEALRLAREWVTTGGITLRTTSVLTSAVDPLARSVVSLHEENERLRAALGEACDRINFLRDNGYHKPFRKRTADEFADQTRIEFALMMGLDV